MNTFILRRKNIFTIILLLAAFSVYGQSDTVWSADNIKIVYLEDSTQFVCDPDNLLTKQYKDSANYYLNKLKQEFDIQSVFVTANHIKDGDAFRMSQDIGNNYGVGYKDTKTGLVVVLAVEDRQFFIATGKGLEAYLPDTTCNNIANQYLKPNMQEGNVDLAVMETCKSFYQKISNLEQKPPKHVEEKGFFLTVGDILIIVIVVMLLVMIYFLVIRKKR